MPKRGQLKGTPTRRAEFIQSLRDHPTDECVYWPWSDMRDTYASVHIDGQKMRASRWVYEQFNGPLPERQGRGARGVLVLHRCDNPPCVNPRHTFAGSQAENMADAASKGRMPGGPGNRRGPLTPREVRDIEQALGAASTQADIARAFGVSQSVVSKIATGKHVPVPRARKISDTDAAMIVRLHASGVRQAVLARAYGVSQALISVVVRGANKGR